MTRTATAAHYVLAADVTLVPVDELAPADRVALACAPGDLILDRPTQRAPSKLVSAETARLLAQFRTPATIAEAVIALAKELAADPHELLDAVAPVVSSLVQSQILLPEDAARAATRPGPDVGGRIGAFTVVRVVRALEDTAVYLARDEGGAFVAVKRAAPEATTAIAALRREAELLERLRGRAVPELLGMGEHDGAPYLALRWIEGLPVDTRADELRRDRGGGRVGLRRLCARVAGAVADVHDAGVLHGDLGAANVLVDRDDRVHLIDFGMARGEGDDLGLRSWRFESLEPEAAHRALADEVAPMTPAAEQFALGALLYRMATGRAFRLPREHQRQALEAIAAYRAMPPFTTAGCEAWPRLEEVLRRALDPDPAARYPSTRALAADLRALRAPVPRARGRARDRSDLVDRWLDVVTAPGSPDALDVAPTASVHRGAAGVAWFLYRAAQVREDGVLLAHADLWARAAVSRAARAAGLVATNFGVDPARSARSAPLHDASGPEALRGLIAHAQGDLRVAETALARVVETMRRPSDEREVFMGSSGHLLTGATLRDALGSSGRVDVSDLDAELARLHDELATWLETLAPVGTDPRFPHLGVAHGWAGVLWALLQAGAYLGRSPSSALDARLDELARRAEPIGRGVAWRGTPLHGHGPATPDYAPGWCSGAAGFVTLWLRAFAELDDERYRRLAMHAGWHAWEHPDERPLLCCGLAGRALAMLGLYRALGNEDWLERARRLVARARSGTFEEPVTQWSLFRGELGLATVALELERPAAAVLPLLEPEGWSEPLRPATSSAGMPTPHAPARKT